MEVWHYDAELSDRTGQQQTFHIPFQLSQEQVQLLQNGDTSFITRLATQIWHDNILPAKSWACASCLTLGAQSQVCTPCVYHESKTIVDFTPYPICINNQSCNQHVSAEAHLAMKELAKAVDKSKGNPSGTFNNSKRYLCHVCQKSTANEKEFKRCGRCLGFYYCSKACQKKHWKHGGHKNECQDSSEVGIPSNAKSKR